MELQLTPADKLSVALAAVQSGQWAGLFDEGEDLSSNPVALYLLKNQHDTRVSTLLNMATAIEVLTGKSGNPARFPWWQIEYKDLLLLRTALQAKYTGNTTNRVLAVMRGVLKEAWRLKLMTTSNYLRACSIENVARDVRKSGRYISHEEMAALFKAWAPGPRRSPAETRTRVSAPDRAGFSSRTRRRSSGPRCWRPGSRSRRPALPRPCRCRLGPGREA